MGKPTFNCTKCPGFCCNYEHIPVNKRDLKRLAKHFDLPLAKAEQRFTKVIDGTLGLRHHKDHIYKSTCMMFDQKKRSCTIYTKRGPRFAASIRTAALAGITIS